MAGTTEELCWLCSRPLGAKIEYHHPVPKSRGGRMIEPVHPICHRTLHRTLTNKQLGAIGGDVAKLRAVPEIARFLAWIANKPPDFHAPTHRRR
jgi:hypothetical protein